MVSPSMQAVSMASTACRVPSVVTSSVTCRHKPGSLVALPKAPKCAGAVSACNAAVRERTVSVRASSSVSSEPKSDIRRLKEDILKATEGLDTGLAARAGEEQQIEQFAQALVAAGGDVELPDSLSKLDGLWRLVFSSGLMTGTLGGRRPGPSVSTGPLRLGQVFQRISVPTRELDNIVTLHVTPLWPLRQFDVTPTLNHSFVLTGKKGLRITFQKTTLKTSFGPDFGVPQLPDFLRNLGPGDRVNSGEFEILYLDEDMRITRGDRGELRVFVRA